MPLSPEALVGPVACPTGSDVTSSASSQIAWPMKPRIRKASPSFALRDCTRRSFTCGRRRFSSSVSSAYLLTRVQLRARPIISPAAKIEAPTMSSRRPASANQRTRNTIAGPGRCHEVGSARPSGPGQSGLDAVFQVPTALGRRRRCRRGRIGLAREARRAHLAQHWRAGAGPRRHRDRGGEGRGATADRAGMSAGLGRRPAPRRTFRRRLGQWSATPPASPGPQGRTSGVTRRVGPLAAL
jgi:hypothetical protein